MNVVRSDSWRHQKLSGLLNSFFFSVKKTKSEIVAERASHAAKEKLRKERREEQEWDVQRKKALADKSKADAPGITGEVADDDGDGSSKALSDEGGDDDDDGEPSWDEDEEVSEGEVSEDDDARSGSCSSDEDEEDKPPKKKGKSEVVTDNVCYYSAQVSCLHGHIPWLVYRRTKATNEACESARGFRLWMSRKYICKANLWRRTATTTAASSFKGKSLSFEGLVHDAT